MADEEVSPDQGGGNSGSGEAVESGRSQTSEESSSTATIEKPKDRPNLPTPQAVLQIVCIIGVVVVAIYDLRTADESVPAIVYGTLLGAALGLDPMAILKGWAGK